MMVRINYSWYFMHLSSFLQSLVFVIGNEEKRIALLVYSTFGRVAGSMLRRISVFTSSGSQLIQVEVKLVVNTVSVRNQYSITAQISGRKDCDVTRLVAREPVWNKYPLLESFTLCCSSSTFLIH